MTIAENQRQSPAIDWLQLEPVLHLDPLGADRFAANTLSPNMSGAIFGGQYIANVVGAAMLTAGDHAPHMMQAFFLRAGDLSAPLQLSVQRVRDGRRFSHRRVEVQQNGRLLMTADVSLYQGSGHNTHQRPPPVVPAPEQLEDLYELIARHGTLITPATVERMLRKKAVQVRPVDAEAAILRRPDRAPLALWLKPSQVLPDERYFQYTALSYLSDYWLGNIANALHTDSIFKPDARVLSLNHSLWFHATPTLNDWLLYSLDSPASGKGLGLGRGAFYDRSGRMLVSAMQEALLPA